MQFNDTASVASMSEMSVSLKGKDGRFATAAKHLADFDDRSESLQWNLLAQQDSEIIHDLVS